MDAEIAFPNPIERTDLPVPRKKWKWALGISLVLLVIAVALLPQILSSKVGRTLVTAYLGSKFRGEAFMTDFRTSWGGPTTISKFAFNDPEARQIRFVHMSAPIGVIDLLRGNFELEGATIQDLFVEYVVDYGDGTDTLLRLTNKKLPPADAPRPPVDLPDVTGKVTLKNATVVLSRGQIQGHRGFRTVFRSMRFAEIEGTIDVREALDQPFTCDLKGTVGGEGSWGTFTFGGMVDLGENGRLDMAKGAADLKLRMTDVPNTVGSELGSLLWVLVPAVRAEDYAQMFGPTLTKVVMDMKVAEGELSFDAMEVEGQIPRGGPVTTLSGRPVIDLTARPRALEAEGDIVASVRLSRGMCEKLGYINPFILDAAPDAGGDVRVRLSDLYYPLPPGWQPSLGGEVSARDVTLVSGQVFPGEKFPRELTTQWQAVVGNFSPSPKLEMPSARFGVKSGFVTPEPYEITIDGQPVKLSGSSALNGRLRMQAEVMMQQGLAKASAEGERTLAAAITGTMSQPQLELPGLAALGPMIDQNMNELRARKAEQLLRKSELQIEQMMESFERMRRMDEERGRGAE